MRREIELSEKELELLVRKNLNIPDRARVQFRLDEGGYHFSAWWYEEEKGCESKNV